MVAGLDNCSRFTQLMRLVEILTSHPQYIGPFTVLPGTVDSLSDYPLHQEFSDDSFSFSVISFTNISLRHQAGCLETIKCPDYLVRDFFHLLSLSFNLSVLLNDLALYLYQRRLVGIHPFRTLKAFIFPALQDRRFL